MVEYDADLLKSQANRLYQQAKLIAFFYTVLGVLFGLAIYYFFYAQQPKATQDAGLPIICMVFCGLIGLAVGLDRGFKLKVRAQEILCQVAIEENTNARMPARY